MRNKTANILIDILSILNINKKEQKEVTSLFNKLARKRILKSLECQLSYELRTEIIESPNSKEALNKMRILLKEEKVIETVVQELMDFTREFLKAVIDEATKEQKTEIEKYLEKVDKNL